MITQNYIVEIAQHHYKDNDRGGKTLVDDPPIKMEVSLTIDDAMIASWLGNRAARSKRGVSQFMDKLVTCKIVKKAQP